MVIDFGLPHDPEQVLSMKKAIQRLKDEHKALRVELEVVQAKGKEMIACLHSAESARLLEEIREHMTVFVKHLEDHENWEEQELFPLFYNFLSKNMDSAIFISRWVLEEDHKQAERFVRAFLEASEGRSMIEITSLFQISCSVLAEHLTSEEDMFFPVVEQILNHGTIYQ
ncbi:hemerythrin domain-containing protein [Paenibacillus sp. GCM10027628]|uniref:hemerythrin domain-containing protein n=1 Tax=Paenibacillus sp. GCM10027628 TaxID=3273413 RepID=UPI003625C03F